jgi:hypothetical protein
MGISSMNCLIFVMLLFVFNEMQTIVGESVSCNFRRSPCFAKKIQCPSECPSTSFDPNHKVKPKTCYLDCLSPVCKAECKSEIFIYSFLVYFLNIKARFIQLNEELL